MSQHKVTNGEYLEFVQAGATRRISGPCRGGPVVLPRYVRGYTAAARLARVCVARAGRRRTRGGRDRALADRSRNSIARRTERPRLRRRERRFPALGSGAGHCVAAECVRRFADGRQRLGVDLHPLSNRFPVSARFSFYPGYSANFFDGQHYVLKGGSPRTAACLLRPSFRNWFRPAYPYIYATFRLVEN